MQPTQSDFASADDAFKNSRSYRAVKTPCGDQLPSHRRHVGQIAQLGVQHCNDTENHLQEFSRKPGLCSAIILHEVFWYMPVSARIVDWLVWWSCKNPHENWCEEPCSNSKNNSFTWTKETIRMISMLRKKACSGSIHDLAHISTQKYLADCLTKASAKADNVIPSVKTGLEVDMHPNFRTFMEHKTFLATWCRTFVHTKENDVLFLDVLKVSVAPTSQ